MRRNGRFLRDLRRDGRPGYVRPVSSLHERPKAPSAEERERRDAEYALLDHRGRRRFWGLLLLPHASIALLVWTAIDERIVAWLFAVTLASHAMIVRSMRRPPFGRR